MIYCLNKFMYEYFIYCNSVGYGLQIEAIWNDL